jgi:hypothetical protein
VDVLAVLNQVAMLAHDRSQRAAVAAALGLDVDLHVDVAQVARLGLTLSDFSAQLSARDGLVKLESLQAAVPSGLVAAAAKLDLRAPDPRWDLQAQLEFSQADSLFSSIRQDWGLAGAGQLDLSLESSGFSGAGDGLAWQGEGSLLLWDGSWEVLSYLKGVSEIEPADAQFSLLEAAIELRPTRIELPSLQVSGGAWGLSGNLDLMLPGTELLAACG